MSPVPALSRAFRKYVHERFRNLQFAPVLCIYQCRRWCECMVSTLLSVAVPMFAGRTSNFAPAHQRRVEGASASCPEEAVLMSSMLFDFLQQT